MCYSYISNIVQVIWSSTTYVESFFSYLENMDLPYLNYTPLVEGGDEMDEDAGEEIVQDAGIVIVSIFS